MILIYVVDIVMVAEENSEIIHDVKSLQILIIC